MPDVMYEGARTDFDVAHEVCSYEGDVVGVACFPVDEHYDGTPTGLVDPLPIRVYVLDGEGESTGNAGTALMAYLDLDGARELRDTIDAAIAYVELVRDRRRRGQAIRGKKRG